MIEVPNPDDQGFDFGVKHIAAAYFFSLFFSALRYSEPPRSSKLELVNTNFKCRKNLPAFRDEIFKQKEQKHTRDYDNKV